MYADINLVTDKDSVASEKSRINKLKKISYFVLFLVTVSSILLFILNVKYSVNSVQEKQSSVLNDLNIYNENAVKVIFLNLRATDIKTILSTRTNYQTILESFLAEKPNDVEVQGFSMNGVKASITLSSKSLLDLNNYLNILLKKAEEQGMSNITLGSLSVNDSGYLMIVSMDFSQ